MTRSLPALVLLAPLLAALPARAGALVEPGEWEQEMTISAPEMQSGPMHRTVRQCITSDDVEIFADGERWAQEMVNANPQARCKVEETRHEGNMRSVVLACEGDVRLSVRHEFQGRTGTIDAESMVGGKLTSRNHIVSKKVADTCSPASIEQWKQQNPGRTFAP
jgi:hypothetical protein